MDEMSPFIHAYARKKLKSVHNKKMHGVRIDCKVRRWAAHLSTFEPARLAVLGLPTLLTWQAQKNLGPIVNHTIQILLLVKNSHYLK